jgi:hypothetical protein
MSTGIKRISFPLKLALPLIVFLIIALVIYSGGFYIHQQQAEANVASFYPEKCLGGWKNVDKIAGQPEVRVGGESSYDDNNSASVKNVNAQVFCGEFAGDIPQAAKHEKVSLHFSWYIDDGTRNFVEPVVIEETQLEVIEGEVSDEMLEPVPVERGDVPIENSAISPSEPASIPEPAPTQVEEPSQEPEPPPTEEPTVFFIPSFIKIAHAEEVSSSIETSETTNEPEETAVADEPQTEESAQEILTTSDLPITSSSSVEIRPSQPEEKTEPPAAPVSEEFVPPAEAYFEVLYTLNGQDWHSLGYVTRIANDVEIEMPIDLFGTVEDLEKVQIALHTVERIDSVPKIYLDALWLEVAYNDIAAGEFVPPGQRPGDVIFSETTYGDETAVVVLRNVELMTLSNVLTTASTTSTTTAVSATTTASTTTNLNEFVATSTLAEIIRTTGVQVELWLHASTTDGWSRVADDSIISRNPQVQFVSGNIFWVDKTDTSVWRFNPRSGGYDSMSFADGKSTLSFRDEAGEQKELSFKTASTSVVFDEVISIEESIGQ